MNVDILVAIKHGIISNGEHQLYNVDVDVHNGRNPNGIGDHQRW